MEPEEFTPPAPESYIADCALVSLTTAYSAPTPGTGSRYVDAVVAHEKRLLTAVAGR